MQANLACFAGGHKIVIATLLASTIQARNIWALQIMWATQEQGSARTTVEQSEWTELVARATRNRASL